MMSRFRQLCALIAIGIVAQLALVQPAQAHDPAIYYFYPWPDYVYVPTYFDENYPTGAWRSRVIDGASQWNNATSTGREPDFSNFGTRNVSDATEPFTGPCLLPERIGVVHYEDLDLWGTSVRGATLTCADFGHFHSFTLVIDNDTNWYTGTGTAGWNQYDLWSVASHEFGHATGWWNHLPEEDEAVCPDDSTRHTMCAVLKSTERQRTLTTHDIHTFDAAY